MASAEKIAALQQFRKQSDSYNYYEILGVSPGCDDSAVRAAYVACTKKYGADFFHGVDAAIMEDVNVVNKRVREAYDHLQKADKRAAYDTELAALETAKKSGIPVPEASSDVVDFAAVFEGDQALSRARALLERGEFNVALKNLETAKRCDPQSIEIDARLAYARFMLLNVDKFGRRSKEKVEETRKILTDAANAMREADYIRYYQGEVEKLEGHNDEALKFYKEANRMLPLPLYQREIHLIETRKNNPKNNAAEDAPKSITDQIKELFSGLFGKKK